MKTFNQLSKSLIVGALMLSTLVALSNTNIVKEKPVSDNGTEKTIHDYFKFPQVLMNYNNQTKKLAQKVEVLFTTDKNGKVNFVLVKTNDAALKTEIEKQFVTLHFNNLKSGVVNSVVLNFKTL